MILPRYRSISDWFLSRNGNRNSLCIASVREYQEIVNRERARADRYGNVFSLVIFQLGETNGELARTLARLLTNRTRFIDQVGWLNGRCIGVVLPNTSAKGARKFAGDVCKVIATKTPPPTYRVLTYPSQWLQGNNGDPNQVSNTDIPKDSKASQANDSTNFMNGLGPLLGYRMPV